MGECNEIDSIGSVKQLFNLNSHLNDAGSLHSSGRKITVVQFCRKE